MRFNRRCVMEVNELSEKAMGGTEMMLHGLHARLSPELTQKFQIIPSRVRTLDPDRKRILWLHDFPDPDETTFLKTAEGRAQFDGIVCVSHFQAHRFNEELEVPYDQMRVLQNAIVPFGPYRPRRSSDRIRIVYHTTPHRGLEILVLAFDYLAKIHPDIELDVFSSFDIYGWSKVNEPYQHVFEHCRNHPRICYHGTQPNSIVRDTLLECDIFAYPCFWPETSCIAAIEAMAAGCLTVCSSLAALPETCANFANIYPYAEVVQTHGDRFQAALHDAIESVRQRRPADEALREKQADYFNYFYAWDRRIGEWEAYLKSML
jgi:UDP-glucose:(glucosyl)LPS alpha-1,2-glucosyltransferase